jgi:hypothetical protein
LKTIEGAQHHYYHYVIPRSEKYIKELRQRAKKSRVYRKHQAIGITIAETLSDRAHTSLYIKLAKEKNGEKLLWLAKDVAERKGVKNKGAYFMYCLLHQNYRQKKNGKQNSSR